jgi:hypothetical protein
MQQRLVQLQILVQIETWRAKQNVLLLQHLSPLMRTLQHSQREMLLPDESGGTAQIQELYVKPYL